MTALFYNRLSAFFEGKTYCVSPWRYPLSPTQNNKIPLFSATKRERQGPSRTLPCMGFAKS